MTSPAAVEDAQSRIAGECGALAPLCGAVIEAGVRKAAVNRAPACAVLSALTAHTSAADRSLTVRQDEQPKKGEPNDHP